MRTSVQVWITDAIGELNDDGEDEGSEQEKNKLWEPMVWEIASGVAEAITDQPTFAAYMEFFGWYAVTGDYKGSRFKNLFTATVDYWPLKTNDNFFLRARFETGYEFAFPEVRKNHMMLTAGVKL